MPETSSPGISDDPGSADNEQAARSLLDAFARFDLDAYESLIAEDAVERRPETGDRFVGRAKIIGMYRHYPADPPVVTWERIRGSGTVFVAEGTIDYDGSGFVERLVAVVEIRDGRMIDSNVYFASVLDPIPYHGPWSNPDERPAG